MKIIVLLTDGTVGEVTQGAAETGETVTVKLHDENGNFIEVVGVVEAVL